MKELEAMKKIARALEGLNKDEINRVMGWTLNKFEVSLKEISGITDAELKNTKKDNDSEPFETVADLFYKFSPSTDAEKALVIGYWFQAIEAESDFDSYTVNTELKHLGHQIGNITRAFNQLMNKKPQLAVQTKKTGNTKQARKKYKLTVAGVKYIEQMIQDES